MKSKIQSNSFSILLIVVILIRVGVFLTIQPQIAKDTGGYTNLANHILRLNFSDYSGARTPGYPLIIALADMNFKIVMIFQLLMGIIISISLYKIILILTKSKLLSLFSGLSYSLYLPQLYRETVILTETTATFFIVLSFLFLLYLMKSQDAGKKQYIYLLLIGVFSSAAALTRPIFIIIPIIFGIFLFYYYVIKLSTKKFLSYIMIFLIPIIILIGGWILIIYTSTGTFGLTTILGFTLMTKVDRFIEKSPDECIDIPNYQLLRNIYIRTRNEYIAEGRHTAMTIWKAKREMQAQTGLTYGEISELIGKIAQKTIVNAPVEYLKEVVKGWIKFWKPVGIGRITISPILRTISKYFERIVFFILEVFFLVFPLIYILFKKLRNFMKPWDSIEITFLIISYIIILLTSVGQALVIWSAPRFSIPIEPILFLTTVVILWKVYSTVR